MVFSHSRILCNCESLNTANDGCLNARPWHLSNRLTLRIISSPNFRTPLIETKNAVTKTEIAL